MRNNDILRRLRYTFDLKDSQMMALFALAGQPVLWEQISGWLKRDEDPAYQECSDAQLAVFLNGFIIEKRGRKDGPQPAPEKILTNNVILMKLRIALNLKAEDVLEIRGWPICRSASTNSAPFPASRITNTTASAKTSCCVIS